MMRLLAILVLVVLGGCEPQSMTQQKRYDTYAAASIWRDGTAARTPPADTVARGDLARDAARDHPPVLTDQVMRRGETQYAIFCTPCHGEAGDGRGIIVARGFPKPPPLASDEQLARPAQALFDVITNGKGVMYPFASRIVPQDRWAIVAYLRALQLAQHAPLADYSDAAARLP